MHGIPNVERSTLECACSCIEKQGYLVDFRIKFALNIGMWSVVSPQLLEFFGPIFLRREPMESDGKEVEYGKN